MKLVFRIRQDHQQTDLRALGLGDVPASCCSICMDQPWPCDAIMAADCLEEALEEVRVLRKIGTKMVDDGVRAAIVLVEAWNRIAELERLLAES